MEDETAGDPMTGLKWTRKATERIANELSKKQIKVSAKTVAKILKGLGFSLRVNHKKVESGIRKRPSPKIRDRQFRYIRKIKKRFVSESNPVISVDGKKKELIGNFRNAGRSWRKRPKEVYDKDFPSDADAKAIPYGIYDVHRNEGFVCVNTSVETPALAVDSIVLWWRHRGRKEHPNATQLLVLADGGPANGPRSRVWKSRLQTHLCNKYGLKVTVCHYPPGSSKWNPIEHRLFSQITNNWEAEPLQSLETILKFIRTTGTSTGMRVYARLLPKRYEKGQKVPDTEFAQIALQRHRTLPDWNYTISPNKM